MGVGADIAKRAQTLAQDRYFWATTWMDIAKLVLPTDNAVNAFNAVIAGAPVRRNQFQPGPNSVTPVKSIYDNTGLWAVDRLAAGMESLVTPLSEKWHGLTVNDFMRKLDEDDKAYLERLRDFLFTVRYDPRAGFISAHQKAMRSTIAYGTGVIYVDEFDNHLYGTSGQGGLISYCFTPLSECLLSANSKGEVDTNFRVCEMTVRQLVQRFGLEKLSGRVQVLADKPENWEQTIPIIHGVMPRQESGSSLLRGTVRGSPVASYYVEFDTQHLIQDGGYFEFPYIVYHWLQSDNGPYGESPVMLALSEIKSLQAMGKAELRAFSQLTDPPLGTTGDGTMNRPNLNPRAINPGAVGPNGELRIKPIITTQSPDFAEKVMDVRRNAVKETLYINLFQILIKNPEMTATEAMLRANEKGELLGPAGGKIQSALSHLVDREIGILGRRGIFHPDSPLAAPPSLLGADIGARMTSPLDRIRRANEAVGIQRLFEFLLPLAKEKPEVLDRYDLDAAGLQLREIYGAPAAIEVSEAVFQARRNQSAKMGNMQTSLAAGQGIADITKSASIGARNIGDTAINSPQIMDALNEILQRLRTATQGAGAAATPQAQGAVNGLLQQFGEPPALPPPQSV